MNGQLLWLLGMELVLLVLFAAERKNLAAGGLAAAGVMLVATTQNAIILFAALEMVSGCTWLMLYSRRVCLADTSITAAELTTRHVLLCLVGSALLLLGLSFVCGTLGTTDCLNNQGRLCHICNTAVPGCGPMVNPELMRLAAALIFAGLGIRVGAVPFAGHLPHTCGLITNRCTMLLLLLPWFAGTIALTRLVATILPGLDGACWPLAGLLAVASMGYAGIAALGTQNVRRLAAYIIIAQSGFLLLGPAAALSPAVSESATAGVFDSRAVAGTLFYLLAIAPSAIGALGVLVYLGREGGQIDVVDELAGMGRTRPWIAAAMTIFLLSLAGMPPLAGFWARTAVLLPTITVALTTDSPQRWWFAALAVAAGASTVLTMVACARLVVVMYFRLPLATPRPQGGRAAAAALVGCVILTVLISSWIDHVITTS